MRAVGMSALLALTISGGAEARLPSQNEIFISIAQDTRIITTTRMIEILTITCSERGFTYNPHYRFEDSEGQSGSIQFCGNTGEDDSNSFGISVNQCFEGGVNSVMCNIGLKESSIRYNNSFPVCVSFTGIGREDNLNVSNISYGRCN